MSTLTNDKIVTYSFCDPFLDNLADYIEANYLKKGRDLSRLAIVFGGKRPALFLKRELGRRIKSAYYPPRFFTIDEFMAYTVNKKESFGAIKDLDGCYWLYALAKKVTPEILKGRETFAQFLPWTREILGFIDQLDLESVEDPKLFNIQSNAAIGYPVPADINRLLQHIVVLRKSYHKFLLDQQTYNRGYQYLRAAEVIKDIAFEEFDQILFCNFFYFHKTEQTVIQSLYERDQAVLLFQGDQRKWPVLTRIAKSFDCSLLEGEEPKRPQFDLKLYSGFDVHSQMGLVREVLGKIDRLDKTVIVVPNPDNIVPLLSEISTLVEDFNVSMGYPLKRSSLYSLFEFVFKAQTSKKEDRYYTKDYLKVLRHPFVKNLRLGPDPSATRIFIHKIEEILTGKENTSISGSLFIELEDIESLDELYMITLNQLDRLGIKTSRQDLLAMLEKLHVLLFRSWEDITTFAQFGKSLENLLDVFVQKSFLKNYPLNLNIAQKMYVIKDELLSAAFKGEEFPPEDIFRIFDSKVSQEFVAFHGQPLKGLQVLGLLETRSLNFENVVILDVNEGLLPKLRIYEPLIPREVMIGLNLDRLEWEEEIQRYQFMRLISSAKSVHLIYQEGKDKEKSRFIQELIWEEEKHQKKIDVVPAVCAKFEVKVANRPKEITKTPELVAYLKNMKYSASSVNTYLRNPMEFYFKYVLRLQETDDLLDEPEARHVGTFIHAVLEEAFKPYLGKKPEINSAFRNRFSKIFEQRFTQTFEKSMKSDSFLLKSVLVERLNRLLDNEENNPERQIEEILYLEHRFEDAIDLPSGMVKFKYIVDRVDKLKDGTVMIVDYKTGAIDQMPKSIERFAELELSRETIRENVRSFQIPLYFHYLNRQFPSQPINAALYSLRTFTLTKFISDESPDRAKINSAFLRPLDFIMAEIFDPAVAFVEDETEYGM